jgi:hypothetical protein
MVLLRTYVSEEHIASIITVKRISKLETTLAVSSFCSKLQRIVTAYVIPSLLILPTLMMEVMCSFETSITSRPAWRHIPEDFILYTPLSLLRLYSS